MLFRFLDCELDTDRCELRRAGEPVALRAKVFRLLLFLIEQRHRRVPKDELLDRVWAGRVVSDATLSSCIKTLRRAVGDDGERQRVIQTVRGLGYRFVAEVWEASPPATPPPAENTPGEISADVTPGETLPDSGSLTGPGSVTDPVPTDAPSRPPPVPEPFRSGREHKQLSVLCGNLTNAGTLLQQLDPEAVDRLMQDLFVAAGQAVERYGGVIVQHHGDGFTALFGAPHAHEDHARRAVLAAIALRERLATRESVVANVRPAMGFGIHAGPVVVGTLTSAPGQLYTALGTTTDLAARLQRQAAPGTLLISAAVHGLVSAEVRAVPRGVLDDDAGVAVYAVEGIDRLLGGVPRGRMASRFVGRDRELGILQQCLERIASGRGQVIGVVGEPGIGKSRLLEELRRRIEEPSEGTLWLEGRCLSYGETSPYLPLLDVLRQCCGIGAVDDGDAAAGRISEALDRLDVTVPGAASLLQQLLGLASASETDADVDPQQRRARVFASLRQLVQQRAQRRPCVLVIEDAHWIDATSDEWLTELIARLAGMPLLLLVTYRPGYRPVWLERSEATQLALPPLTRADSEQLLRSLPPLGPVGGRPLDRIVATAQGNPFFLEELSSWASRRTDARQIDRIVATRPGESLELEESGRASRRADAGSVPTSLPDTVQAVIAARIDRLDPHDKRLLQAAAVIGASVPLALLHDLLPFADDELERSLRRLQSAEFLYETQTFPATLYTFRHALTREVAYRTLLHDVRRRLHREIAQLLDRASAEPLAPAELIAHHYTEAGLSEPAIDCWQRAARHAGQRSAAVEAIGHLERALRLFEALPDRDAAGVAERELALQLELGVLAQVVDGPGSAEAERVYARASRLSERVGSARERFAALWGNWRLHDARGDYGIALRTAEDLLALAEREGEPYLLLEARHALWTITGSLGRLEAAREHIARGIALTESGTRSHGAPTGGHDPLVCAHGTGAIVTWLLGHPDGADRHAEETLKIASRLDHPPSLAKGLVHLVNYHQLRREVTPLRKRAEQLIACATEHGFATPRARGLFASGWCLAEQGRPEEGIARMRQALVDLEKTGFLRSTPYLHALLVECCAGAGELEQDSGDLEKTLLSGIGIAEEESWLSAETCRLVGDILLSRKCARRARAERYLLKAIAVARRQGARSIALRAAASLCRHRRRGQERRRQDRERLASIRGEFTEGLDSPDLLDSQALLDELA